MDDGALLERTWNGLEANYRLFSKGAPANRFIDFDGLGALVVPPKPEARDVSTRAATSFVLNSVLCRDSAPLARCLDELREVYEAAGARAWTVWIARGDERAAALMKRAGHEVASTPTAMGLELARFSEPAQAQLEWTREADVDVIVELLDIANGWEETRPWAHALRALPEGSCRVYMASIAGRPVSGVLTHDHEGDASIGGMATLSCARGSGLATALLARALVDARDRGCETSTLQSTPLAVPLYERLGYRQLAALEGWVRWPDLGRRRRGQGRMP